MQLKTWQNNKKQSHNHGKKNDRPSNKRYAGSD